MHRLTLRRLRSWSGLATMLVLATSALLMWATAASWWRPPLSPDSWTYLLLGRSFHHTAYSIPLIRQYQFPSDMNDAFPPVWPLLIFAASWLLSPGPRIGMIVAIVLSFALLPTLMVMLRPFVAARGRRQMAAAAGWAAIISFSPCLDEILSGRSSPPTLLLYAALLMALTRASRLTLASGALAGLAGGLLWMTRFDTAPLVVVIGLVLPFVRNPSAGAVRTRLPWWTGYALLVAAIIAPWIVYSRHFFGVSFATGPGAMAMAVAPSLVTDWYPAPRPTFFDQPMAWLARVIGNVPSLFMSLQRAILRYAHATSLLTVVAAWAAVEHANARLPLRRNGRIALLFTFAILCQLVGPVFIGGYDLRYFIPLLAAMALWSICLLINASAPRFRFMLLPPLLIGLALGWTKALGVQRGQRASFAAIARDADRAQWPEASGVSLELLDRCLPLNTRVLMVDEGLSAYFVGYYLHRMALQLPDNWGQLSDDERSLFLTRLHVSHLVVVPGAPSVPIGRTLPIAGCDPVRTVSFSPERP